MGRPVATVLSPGRAHELLEVDQIPCKDQPEPASCMLGELRLLRKKPLKGGIEKEVFPAAQKSCIRIPSLAEMKIAQNDEEPRLLRHGLLCLWSQP